MDLKKEIDKFVKTITKDLTEPMDGDNTERIGLMVELELNKHQGNINQAEYEQQLALIEKC